MHHYIILVENDPKKLFFLQPVKLSKDTKAIVVVVLAKLYVKFIFLIFFNNLYRNINISMVTNHIYVYVSRCIIFNVLL